MASSCQNKSKTIFDEIRKLWVAATPEEIIRQKLLRKMIDQLGFPKEHLAVEKELKELPHLQSETALPPRRIDLIAFGKNIHPDYPFYPLLLVECKREKIDAKAEEQLLGYNRYVKAPFFALAGEDELRCGYLDLSQKPIFINFLPRFSELLDALKR